MPDQIGNIVVPALVAAGIFPLAVEFPFATTRSPQVVTHVFGAGNAKREQRFYLGNGARQFTLSFSDATETERSAVRDHWEDRQGALLPFTFNNPLADGTTQPVICCYANEPLGMDYQLGLVSRLEIHLVEVNLTAGPAYPVADTVTRFPSPALAAALTEQVQELIPLVHIKVRKAGYPDNIYVSDRRCTVGGQLYQARLLRWSEITQTAVGLPNTSAESDNVQFVFGNADRVMRQLADDVQLEQAEISFSIYHVGSEILCNFWKGVIVPGGWQSNAGPEFSIQCSDRISSPFLILPNRIIDRKCDKLYNDGLGECPFALEGVLDLAHFPAADGSFCDHGYETDNGCLAHGMKRHYNGVIAVPQAVRIQDNATGFMGIGRTAITSVSLVGDSVYGYPLKIVVTDVDFPVKADIIAGRDESEFYEALGIACLGPVVLGATSTLDGSYNHGYPGPLGLRNIPGNDPAGPNDWLSLDQSGDQRGGDFRKVFSGNSTYLDNFSAGVAFVALRKSDEKGIQLTTLDQHDMELIVSQGWQGWRWAAPGARATGSMTNPVWLAVNVYLLCLRLWRADAATQELYFDVDAAIAAAAIADAVVDRVVETDEGLEAQFKAIGVIKDARPLRDWLNDILANCLGFYTFDYGRLSIGIRENAGAAVAFTEGNMLYKSLELGPISPQFTRLTATFADREHGWVPNTATYQDDDYAQELGGGAFVQHRSAQINLSLTADISQAQRIVTIRGREETGGVNEAERKAARAPSFKTTILALDTKPGMVASITDDEMPGGVGKFRIEKMTLAGDWSVSISGRAVTESTYDLVTGRKPADVRPGEIPPEIFADPGQPVWHPNQDTPLAGDPVFGEDDSTFGVGQEYNLLTDNAKQAVIAVTAKFPVTTYLPNTVPPIIHGVAQVNSGGSLDGDRSYFFRIWCRTADGVTGPSNIVHVYVPAGSNANKITLSDIAWPAGAFLGYSIAASIDDVRSMCTQADVGGALPATIVISDMPKVSTYNPPSRAPLKVRAKAKLGINFGPAALDISAVAAGSITCAGLAGADDWSHRKLQIIAKADLSDVAVLDFACTGFNGMTGEFTGVTPDPVTAGVEIGDVLLILFKADIVSDTSIGDSKLVNAQSMIENPPLGGLIVNDPDLMGAVVYKRTRAGLWEIRNIVSNTNDAYEIDKKWDVNPDADTLWYVATREWVYFNEATIGANALPSTPVRIRIIADNLKRKPVLVIATIVDQAGQETPEELAHFRPLFLYGESGASTADGYTIDPIVANEVTPDLANGRNHEVVLVSGTQITIKNPVFTGGAFSPGDWFQMRIVEDAIGEHPTPAWDTDYIGVNGIEIKGDADAYTTFQFTLNAAMKWVLDYHSLSA